MKTPDRNLKIAIVVSYTYPYKGSGIGNVAREQAEHLVKLGHSVTLISGNFPKGKEFFIHDGVSHLKLPGTDLLELFNIPVPLLFFNKQATSTIKNADLIHIHDYYYPSSLAALIIAKIYKKPVVLTVHIVKAIYMNLMIRLIEKSASSIIGKVILSLTDRIVIINKSDLEDKKLKNYKKKIEYIPNGVDKENYKPVSSKKKAELRKLLGLSLDKKILLFIGRFVPKKGFDLLIRTDIKDSTILMVGDPKNRKIPHNKKNLNILGVRSKKEIVKLFQLSDAFILPSYGEGFPLSVQEAMLSGLPLILGRYNDYVKQFNEKLVLLTDYSQDSVSEAINKLFSSDTRLIDMKRYSLDFSRKNFITWNQNAEKTVNLYKSVLK